MRCVNATLALALLMAVGYLRGGDEESIDALISRVSQNPTDSSALDRAIFRLGHSSDPRVVPLFRRLFSSAIEKQYRQKLALVLLNLGDKDNIYFDELTKYAREAITTSAPLSVLYDDEGTAVPNKINPEFEMWCRSNRLPLQDCLRQTSDYIGDVLILAAAKDRRAIPLLRQGLHATNHAVVGIAARGLAWLNDTDSIPLIAEACGRLPARLAPAVADAAAEFDDPRVEPLIQRFIPSEKWRQEIEQRRRERGQKAQQK